MPIERDAAIRTAEKLLRQGKLEAAIGQYVQLIDEYPSDWSAIQTLGDLYVRAGAPDRALAQFVRVADHHDAEGALEEAAAACARILKVRPDDEPTLLRLARLAQRRGLAADARAGLRRVAELRQARGDEKGAVECLIELAGFDEHDAEAKLAAAHAARSIGQVSHAQSLLQQAAAAFEANGRSAEALDAWVAAAELAPSDPDLLIAAARGHLLTGGIGEAQPLLMRALAAAPDRHAAVERLSDELVANGRVDEGYACVEIAADAALFEADFERAAAAIEAFVMVNPTVPSLLKLVDVYVDAGFDERIPVAQRQLADAYVRAGQPHEARVIAEDLFFREPSNDEHVERLRRVLMESGVVDVEAELSRLRELAPLFLPALDTTAPAGADGDPAANAPSAREESAALIEIDLSERLAQLSAAGDETIVELGPETLDGDSREAAPERDREPA